MAFIKEKILEQYWDKLKQLGLFDETIQYSSWLADYKRSIFSWSIFPKEHDRDDHAMYWVILWEERKIIIRELIIDNSIESVWNEDVLLKKGLIITDIVGITAYGVLPEEKNELLAVIQEVDQARSQKYVIQIRNMAEPEFKEG